MSNKLGQTKIGVIKVKRREYEKDKDRERQNQKGNSGKKE